MMKSRTGFFGLVLVFTLSLMITDRAFAQNLDLASLASFDYIGKDANDSKSQCQLNVSQIGKDFSGRFFQDFRAWVNGRSDLNFNIRLKGADRYRAPESMQGMQAQFSIPMDVYLLVLIANAADPSQISEYRLMDASGLTSAPLIRCTGIKAQPR